MPEMFVLPFRPAYDSNGRFVPGAQAWFTLTGTNTETPVYADEALTIEQPNPLVADGLGKFPRSFLDPAITYRVRVYEDEDNATVGVDDPIDDHDYDPYTGQEMGSEGPQGESAVAVTIGTTTTGAAGTNAIVANSGTATNPVLDFTIPRGNTGATSGATWGSITGTLADQTDLGTALGLKAALASPALTGTPTAPTQTVGNNSTRLATTAFVAEALAADRVISIDIPAGAMKSRTTNGAASGSTETTSNKLNFDTLDFDASTAEYAQFIMAMPKSWDEGTVTAQFLWYAPGGTGNVVWAIQGVSITNDAVLDAAFGTAQTVTDGVAATTDLMQTAFTSAVTIGSTPASEDLVVFQVYRDASNGADTLGSDAKLLAIRLNFTLNAADDS